MKQQKLIQVAEQLCRDWQHAHDQLLIESNRQKKEQLLYKELLLERQFDELADTYHYYTRYSKR